MEQVSIDRSIVRHDAGRAARGTFSVDPRDTWDDAETWYDLECICLYLR